MSSNTISTRTTATTLRSSLVASLLVVACASSFAAQPQLKFLGEAASAQAATQTINITPATKYVNVTSGQTVRFVSGDKSFAWNFNVGTNVYAFDLNRVAPDHTLNQQVKVYVAQDVKAI